MFRFLQFVVACILFAGILLLFRRKLHRSRGFVTGLSVVLVISAICSGVIINAIPMPTEMVRITATGEKRKKATGNIVGIKNIIVDGKQYPIDSFEEGTWFYSKDDAAHLWLNEGDKRLKKPVTQEVTLAVPVGAGRKLVFLTGEGFGVAQVSYGDEYQETYDLYKAETSIKKVTIPDSNRVYDDTIKLCRLGGYSLIIICALALAVLLEKSVEKDILRKLIYMMLSVITTLTFYIDTGLTARSGRGLFSLIYDFMRSFPAGNFVLAIILVPMLYKTFSYCGELYRKNFATVKGTLCIVLPAGLFAAFMVIGDAFIKGDNTLRPIFDNELQILKSLFGATGYFVIFFFGITWIFQYLDCVDICKASTKKYFKPVQMYLDSLSRWPFRTAFLTIFIFYIPYIIISYPAIFMGDTKDYLSQIYGHLPLNNAHPLTPTLFWGLCIKAGLTLFNSDNMGLFICVMTQFIFIISVVSFVIKVLTECHVSSKISVLLMIYYMLHPRIQYWMFLLTKDILNAAFLFLFIFAIYMIFTNRSNIYTYIALGIADLGTLLFRHDNQYIIIISLIIMLVIMRRYRKILAVTAICSLCFVLIWNGTLLNLNILREHPERDNLDMGILGSIMEQQTARYIRDAGDEVTQEEYEIINTVFNYEKIVSAYAPDNLADGVAGTLRKSTATSEDVSAYKKVWFKMFFKHPEIYLEATLNHKYQYLYPSVFTTYYYSYTTSAGYMDKACDRINENVKEISVDFSYPSGISLDFRVKCQNLRESFFRMPIFNLLYTTSSYFWMLFIWFAYCILRNNKIAVATMMPLLVMILVLLAGPSNGMYFRYSYPYALCLPVIIVFGLLTANKKTVEKL